MSQRRRLSGLSVEVRIWEVRQTVVNENGKPTLLVQRAHGTPFVVLSVEVDRSRIRAVWAIGNPDKLSAVAASRSAVSLEPLEDDVP
jgi:hypothetical protein